MVARRCSRASLSVFSLFILSLSVLDVIYSFNESLKACQSSSALIIISYGSETERSIYRETLGYPGTKI